MLQRHSIPHFKPLLVDITIPEGQGRGNIRTLPRPLLLKSTFFTEWVWQANNKATPPIFRIKNAYNQGFQKRY